MARARASRLEFGVPKRDGAETPLAELGVGSHKSGKELSLGEEAVSCQPSACRLSK